jgi:hypothetical protein
MLQKRKVPKFLKDLLSFETRSKLRGWETDFYWYIAGMPNPPVSSFTRLMMKKWSRNFPHDVFVESGTFGGDTVEYFKNKFKKIYSMELEPTIAKKAQERFKGDSRIEIIEGDSTVVLPQILSKITGPAVFWLDGHLSAEGTAKGDLETPVLQEVEAILNHSTTDHLIFIDDARCFDGTHDYPTIESLRNFVKEKNPNLSFEIKRDMIIIRLKEQNIRV